MEDRFDFKFKLDQQIKTPFSNIGLVVMLGFDDGGRKYYVQTAKNSDWFKEGVLEAIKPVALFGEEDVEYFIASRCDTTNQDSHVGCKDLYKTYLDWFETFGPSEKRAPAAKEFSRCMEEFTPYKRKKIMGVWQYEGLSLIDKSFVAFCSKCSSPAYFLGKEGEDEACECRACGFKFVFKP